MVHIDIKKLGKFNRTGYRITGDRHGMGNARGIGWEFDPVKVHVVPFRLTDANQALESLRDGQLSGAAGLTV